MKMGWLLLIVSMVYWDAVAAEEFLCPPQLSTEMLIDIVNRARDSRADLPPPLSGRTSVIRKGRSCTHFYQEVQLPSSTRTWNTFYIDAFGMIMGYSREENGTITHLSDEQDRLLDKGTVGP